MVAKNRRGIRLGDRNEGARDSPFCTLSGLLLQILIQRWLTTIEGFAVVQGRKRDNNQACFPAVPRLYRTAAFFSASLGGGGAARSANKRLLSRAESLIGVEETSCAARRAGVRRRTFLTDFDRTTDITVYLWLKNIAPTVPTVRHAGHRRTDTTALA